MANLDRVGYNLLDDGAFETFVHESFPESDIVPDLQHNTKTTQIARELNQYLAMCQSVCASVIVLNNYETD